MSIDLPEPQRARDSALAWAEADPAFNALLTAGVPMPAALLRWGADLFRAGRGADAATVFRAAVALAPENAGGWTNLAVALGSAGGDSEAKACLVRSTELARDQPDTWLLLGMAREKESDLAGAEHDYRRAVELDATSSPAWKCLGALLQRKGDADGAIQAFRASLEHGAPDPAVSANLGKMHYEEGRMNEAREAYAAATKLAPDNVHFRRMANRASFACDLIDGSTVDDALAKLDAPIDDELVKLFEATCGALTGFGHRDAAIRLAERRAELWPNSPAARYLLASLLGTELLRSPEDYIVASFDAFADAFDAQLVGVLGYDVPEKLCKLVAEFSEPDHRYEILDAGCGTGLCGPLLRPLARRLTGVDLSPKMLDRARTRGVYDELVCEEVTSFLLRSERAFDRIIAADVLIYFGDLRPIFAAVAKALRPGGIFAMSVEQSDGEDYKLLPSGRFAHRAAYIESAWPTGAVETLVTRETTLRREGHHRVRGETMVFRAH